MYVLSSYTPNASYSTLLRGWIQRRVSPSTPGKSRVIQPLLSSYLLNSPSLVCSKFIYTRRLLFYPFWSLSPTLSPHQLLDSSQCTAALTHLFYTLSLVCSKYICTQRLIFGPPSRLNPTQCLPLNSWKVSLVSVHRGSYLPFIRSLFSLLQAHKIIHTTPLFCPSWRLNPTQCLPINSWKVSCRCVQRLCVVVCLFVDALSYIHTVSFIPLSPKANLPAQHPHNYNIKVFCSLVLSWRSTVPIFARVPSVCVCQVAIHTRGVPLIFIFSIFCRG